MSWNLMHTAQMLLKRGGSPVGGNVAATWRDQTNAADQGPDRILIDSRPSIARPCHAAASTNSHSSATRTCERCDSMRNHATA
jgi:hypothetical protein